VYSAWSQDDQQLSTNLVGNGGELAFVISRENLMVGENTVVLKGENLCGVFTVDSNVTLVVENPVIDQVMSGKSCQSGTVNLSASSWVSGTYTWYETSDAIESIFQGREFVTPVLDKSKVYYVSLITSSGCESSRTAVEATVVNFDMPFITAKENVLHNSYSENVQWYFNDVLIKDATTSTYLAKESGAYTTITNINGCEARADFEFLVTGFEKSTNGLSAYPNPAGNKLYVNVPRANEKVKEAFVVNNVGVKVIVRHTLVNNQVILSTGDLADGFYVLNLDFGSSISTIKIVKIGLK
jgi:hypothetical protein